MKILRKIFNIDASIFNIIEYELKLEYNNNKEEMEKNVTNEWIDDNMIARCTKCDILFSLLNRKHHCRYCGRIFCYNCSNYFINIPNELRSVKKENILDIRSYINPIQDNRVCYKCYIKLIEWNELSRMYSLFALLPLEITDYLNIRLVCKTWYKIAQHHLLKIRNIQYKITDTKWSNYELNMIYINRNLIKGHSKWVISYILAIDWSKEDVRLLDDLMYCERIIDCDKMMCKKKCNNMFSYDELLLLISQNFKNNKLIEWIFNKLDSIDIAVDELLCSLDIYIIGLQKVIGNDSIINEYEKFLLNKCKSSKRISNKLFWILTQLVNEKYFRNFRKKLVSLLDNQTYNQFQYGYDFTNNIIHILTLHPNRRISAIKEFIDNLSCQRFYLPIDITKTFSGIKTEKMYIIQSKTEPIILPCIYGENELYNIMLKRENVRYEGLMMNMIRLVDILLKKDELLDLNIMTYNIQSVNIDGLNNYGYIEFVPNSYTLYAIRDEYKFTLQNFILEKNPYMSINEFRDRFAKSFAAFCVISYVFGVGDRHLDNIMITNDGTLFNIDYGYILGKDPKPFVSYIRITPDMIDALGGISSIHYNKFSKWCGVAYNCVRRHINIIYNMLLILDEKDFSREYIKNYLLLRLNPGISDKDAHNNFMKVVENSYDSYKNNIIDYIHKQYRSNDKISNNSEKSENITNWVQNKLTKLINKIT
jgi:hypothetical protein